MIGLLPGSNLLQICSVIKSRFHHCRNQKPIFLDFGSFGPVIKPQNHIIYLWETPGHLSKIEKNPGTFSDDIVFANLQM